MKPRQFTFPVMQVLALAISLLTGSHAKAQSIIFSGIEGSSSTSHGYLGFIMPLTKKQLSDGLYKKFVISSTGYGYHNDERGSQVFIDGRSNGIDAGLGRTWRSRSAVADLSATIGYRDVKLSPYAPTSDKAGNLLTFNPQLMLWSELSSGIDTDLLATYATGTASSFVRARIGMRPQESYRVGIERKWLNGRNYTVGKTGLFIALKIGPSVHLELNAGREDPEGKRSVAYGGIAISTSF